MKIIKKNFNRTYNNIELDGEVLTVNVKASNLIIEYSRFLNTIRNILNLSDMLFKFKVILYTDNLEITILNKSKQLLHIKYDMLNLHDLSLSDLMSNFEQQYIKNSIYAVLPLSGDMNLIKFTLNDSNCISIFSSALKNAESATKSYLEET